jgi:hypothetical protein
MTSAADQLVADYLKRLDRELRRLPRARRKEIVAEISAHIAEARALHPAETEADVRTLLDRLGEPAEIAAAEPPRKERSRWQEVTAIVLLLLGGFVLLLGWIAGVVLLWTSSAWTTRDKLIGTFVLPGGLLLPFLILGFGLALAEPRLCTTITGSPVVTGVPVGKPKPLPVPPVVSGRTTRTTCTPGRSRTHNDLAVLAMVALVLAPIGTTVYLALRMRPQPV